MNSFRVSPGRIGSAARPQPLANASSKPRRAVVTAVSSFSASETSTELKVLRRQLEYAVQQVGKGFCNAQHAGASLTKNRRPHHSQAGVPCKLLFNPRRKSALPRH
jgi:hypothetical protein